MLLPSIDLCVLVTEKGAIRWRSYNLIKVKIFYLLVAFPISNYNLVLKPVPAEYSSEGFLSHGTTKHTM